MKKIAIIGGGAAGYFAAFHAGHSNPNNSEIVLFEATKNVLAKVLVSGGGRCNVTNNTFDIKELIKKYPRGGKELLAPFKQFGPEETCKWFEGLNVKLKIESDNRIFPETNKSETIADCLEEAVKRVGVEVELNKKIVKILKSDLQNGKFELTYKSGAVESFDRVILATGGGRIGHELATGLGHNIVTPVPSLFTFEIAHELLDGLAGISFKTAKISLKIGSKKIENTGPLLVTHWGLSGPAVIVLSSVAARELCEVNYQAEISINFVPEKNSELVFEQFCVEKEVNPNRSILNSNVMSLPKAFWERVLSFCKVESKQVLHTVSNKHLRKIVDVLTNSNFLISGKGKFKEEFVTAGGVNLKEINFKTMESKICPGLFFAGEVIDVDGVTGGFNFQAAWTTGFIAGSNV